MHFCDLVSKWRVGELCVLELTFPSQSFPMPYTRSMEHRSALPDFKPLRTTDGRFLIQHGISRTNCVDCLDRTNVAQFGIGELYRSEWRHFVPLVWCAYGFYVAANVLGGEAAN